MRLTVLGATGGTGLHLVEQALAAGHDVTAVVRDPVRLTTGRERLTREHLTVVRAEVLDPDALAPAVHGRDAVLSALGSRSRRQSTICSTGIRSVLRAMEMTGTPRLVAVSSALVPSDGAGERPLFRVLVKPLVRAALRHPIADAAAMEGEMRRSGSEWTIVRPPRLTNGPHSGRYRTAIGSAIPGGHTLSRADLAQAMLALLVDPATVKATVGVAS